MEVYEVFSENQKHKKPFSARNTPVPKESVKKVRTFVYADWLLNVVVFKARNVEESDEEEDEEETVVPTSQKGKMNGAALQVTIY